MTDIEASEEEKVTDKIDEKLSVPVKPHHTNLHIEEKVDVVANPLNSRRYEEIPDAAGLDLNIKMFGKLRLGREDETEVTSSTAPGSLETKSKQTALDDCFTEQLDGDILCNFCPGTFKRIGNVRNHLNSKHRMCFKLTCGCGKEFHDSTNLNLHLKSCKQ